MSDDWRSDAERIRALEPRHLLFVCALNSARSQLGEGIARSLAGPGVRISSAGSQGTSVHPLAVAALAEVGIDASGHTSKGLEAIDTASVDAAFVLCDVCPPLPGVERVHWPFPDPMAGARSAEEALEGFRRLRDELFHRLRVVFPSP